MFRKLKRVWTHNNMNYIPNFQKEFPELKSISPEELCDRFARMRVEFFVENKEPVKIWVRLTLPLAILLYIILFLLTPVVFICTGKWGLNPSNKIILFILNWFKQLRIW